MTKGFIALCIVLAVQVSTAYEEAIPVFRQRHGGVGNSTQIIGGKTATRGQFPYQAGITIDDSAFCGGSLISRIWILTAGHCVSGFRKWTVALGAQQIREVNEPGRVTLTSLKGIKHEDYDISKFRNDIAVVLLPEVVELNALINILSLPPRSYQDFEFAGRTVRASGWGKTSVGSSMSPTLQFLDLTVITNAECQAAYGNTITKGILCCSGVDRKTVCNGDSGGPLTLGTGKNMVSLGIASFVSGRGCASGLPSGFTATTQFLDWIINNTGIPVEDN